jgi:hypothetical protein
MKSRLWIKGLFHVIHTDSPFGYRRGLIVSKSSSGKIDQLTLIVSVVGNKLFLCEYDCGLRERLDVRLYWFRLTWSLPNMYNEFTNYMRSMGHDCNNNYTVIQKHVGSIEVRTGNCGFHSVS